MGNSAKPYAGGTPMSFTDSSESLFVKLRSMRISRPALIGAGVLAVICVFAVGMTFFSGQTPAFVAPSDSAEEQQDSDANEDVEDESESDAATTTDAATDSTSQTVQEVVVHVAGAVNSPGIYSVSEGSRVQDAVNAAGGFTSDAASDAVNLARTLQDGEQVLIPTAEEVESGTYVSSTSDTTATSTGSGESATALVNINTAGLDELDTLPGIGPVTAQAIIDEREANGSFTSIEDIQRVSGIGEKKYEKLKDSICV